MYVFSESLICQWQLQEASIFLSYVPKLHVPNGWFSPCVAQVHIFSVKMPC